MQTPRQLLGIAFFALFVGGWFGYLVGVSSTPAAVTPWSRVSPASEASRGTLPETPKRGLRSGDAV